MSEVKKRLSWYQVTHSKNKSQEIFRCITRTHLVFVSVSSPVIRASTRSHCTRDDPLLSRYLRVHFSHSLIFQSPNNSYYSHTRSIPTHCHVRERLRTPAFRTVIFFLACGNFGLFAKLVHPPPPSPHNDYNNHFNEVINYKPRVCTYPRGCVLKPSSF